MRGARAQGSLALITLLLFYTGAQAAPIDDLVLAAELDRGRQVLGLLLKVVDPNGLDDRGRSPLQMALREGSMQALEQLLKDPRLDVNTPNANGETPLMLAAIKGQLTAVQLLVKRGARINKEGWSPLHYACSGPDEGVSAWLLAQGAELDARSPNGSTPLMLASRYGAMDLAEALLAAGADPTLRNDQGLSPLEFAQAAGRNKLVQTLRQGQQSRAGKLP